MFCIVPLNRGVFGSEKPQALAPSDLILSMAFEGTGRGTSGGNLEQKPWASSNSFSEASL